MWDSLQRTRGCRIVFEGGGCRWGVFLGGYKREIGGLSRGFAKRVVVHFGTHLAFRPTRVEWVRREEMRECVLLG